MTVTDQQIDMMLLYLHARLGRIPTEDEVFCYINGTEEERTALFVRKVENDA